jgi:hypothetical protein
MLRSGAQASGRTGRRIYSLPPPFSRDLVLLLGDSFEMRSSFNIQFTIAHQLADSAHGHLQPVLVRAKPGHKTRGFAVGSALFCLNFCFV